jgi:hypothetical protein
MTADPAAATAYERLKVETAEMLGLNTDSASLMESLQVDLVSLLRLQIDDLQGKVLNGEQVDLARLSTALTMLRQLLPEKALVAPAAGPDFSGAKEELLRMLDGRIEALEHKMARDPASARAEFEARLQAAIQKHNKTDECTTSKLPIPNPGGGDDAERDRSVSLPELSPLAAAGSEFAPEPAPPQQTSPQPPLPPKDAPIPQHYLRGPPEPWRPFVDESGIHTSPWRR